MGIQLTGRREDTDIVLTDEIADKVITIKYKL